MEDCFDGTGGGQEFVGEGDFVGDSVPAVEQFTQRTRRLDTRLNEEELAPLIGRGRPAFETPLIGMRPLTMNHPDIAIKPPYETSRGGSGA